MYVVKKLNHHNAIFAPAGRHGKLMEFSRCPILSAVQVAGAVSLSFTTYIRDFMFCEV